MTNYKIIGQQGEVWAAEYLIKLGHQIIAKNKKIGSLELDIITSYRGGIVGIEVKTRQKSDDNSTDNYLSQRQQKNLQTALTIFCATNYYSLETAHLDLIIITINQTTKTYSLRHYKNLF
jgi:putative endonuclease